MSARTGWGIVFAVTSTATMPSRKSGGSSSAMPRIIASKSRRRIRPCPGSGQRRLGARDEQPEVEPVAEHRVGERGGVVALAPREQVEQPLPAARVAEPVLVEPLAQRRGEQCLELPGPQVACRVEPVVEVQQGVL